MADKLKAAVIGCGGAGRVAHLPWYAAHPEVELVGLVDSKIPQAQWCAQRWGGRIYRSVDEMLDKENPDLVSICTPVHLHAQHTVECIQHGCHVLCEKPMAPSLQECRRMIEAAQQQGVILGIGLHKRFNIGSRKAREIILSGEIGEVHFARAHWMTTHWFLEGGEKGFRGKLHTGGGVFQDVGSHLIDLCRWWFNTEIATVQGMIDIFYPELMEVEDHAVAILQFQDGTSGLIETSWIGAKGYQADTHIEEVWVYGSKGALKLMGRPSHNFEPPALEIWEKRTGQWHILPFSIDMLSFEHHHYKRMIDEFVSCVREKRAFFPCGEDGEKAIEGILALYASWHEERKVSLPLRQEPNISELFAGLRERSLGRGRLGLSHP